MFLDWLLILQKRNSNFVYVDRAYGCVVGEKKALILFHFSLFCTFASIFLSPDNDHSCIFFKSNGKVSLPE